jgi:uncharacterized membrane protein YdjX (TVP38/TMEM64 family)
VQLSVSRTSTVAALVAIVAALLVVLYVPAVREQVDALARLPATTDLDQAIVAFRAHLLGFGAWAPLISAVLMVALQVVLAPIPTFLVTLTNGLLFGWAWGTVLSWASSMAGAAACFWIARALGRPVVERLVGGRHALDVADAFFDRHGSRAVLVARLLPFVSFRLISYGAGLTPIGFGRFLLATGIGQLPATVLYAYLGGRMTRSVQYLFWALSITLALSIAGAALAPRRRNRQALARQPNPLVVPSATGPRDGRYSQPTQPSQPHAADTSSSTRNR